MCSFSYYQAISYEFWYIWYAMNSIRYIIYKKKSRQQQKKTKLNLMWWSKDNNFILYLWYNKTLPKITILWHMVYDFVWYFLSSKETRNHYSPNFFRCVLLLLELTFSTTFNFMVWLKFNIQILNTE